jgi:hypothetical protein
MNSDSAHFTAGCRYQSFSSLDEKFSGDEALNSVIAAGNTSVEQNIKIADIRIPIKNFEE